MAWVDKNGDGLIQYHAGAALMESLRIKMMRVNNYWSCW